MYALTGQLYAAEVNVPATPEMKIRLPRRLREAEVKQIRSYPVLRVLHLDGIKYCLENDNWVLLRFSGTESLLRIFCEADTPEKAKELVDWGRVDGFRRVRDEHHVQVPQFGGATLDG